MAVVVVLGVLIAMGSALRGTGVPLPAWSESPSTPVSATPTAGPPADPGRTPARAAGIDVGEVVDTVAHRIVPDASGHLVAEDDRYRARFDADGFEVELPGEETGSVRVGTTALRRRSYAPELAPGRWTAEANVATRALAPGIDERVTARGGEVEWDVVLHDPLPGAGALRLEAELSGLTGEPTAGPGRLRLPVGAGRALAMGDLVVLDATGAELFRAKPEAAGATLRLDVPAEVLDGAAYPLVLDPTLGPELGVSGQASPGAVGDQSQPAVAFDGTNHLVVWTDRRERSSVVYGARVNPAGVVLDPTGITISTPAPTTAAAQDPAVAFDGTNFVVVWHDFRNFGAGDIFGARVSSAGAVLDPAGIAISTAANGQLQPAVAADGTTTLVVWTDQRSGPGQFRVYGARVSTAGAVLDPAGIPLGTAADAVDPAVASDGGNHLVVWTDRRSGDSQVRGTRVSSAGVALDAGSLLISATQSEEADVAFDGTNHLVVWKEFRSGAYGVYGARVSPAGAVLDASGIAISSGPEIREAPAVARNGSSALVVWTELDFGAGTRDIRGARVSPDGAVLDPAGIPIPTAGVNPFEPALVSDGSTALVVWGEPRTSADADFDVHATRVSASGTVLDPAAIVISTTAVRQTRPAVAFDGANHLVVWGEAGSGNVYGARVSAAGTLLDAAAIPISTAAERQSSPAVAFDGSNYLVVWQDDRGGGTATDLYGARVTPAGAVLDPGGMRITSAVQTESDAALAFDGTNHLVVWRDNRAGGFDIYGARVSPGGTVLDPSGIAISSAANTQGQPAVAYDGTNHLVVWTDARSVSTADVYGARVSPTGTVLDPSVPPLVDGGIAISTAPGDQRDPAVASNGSRLLVTWSDSRSGTGSDIYGARVSELGVVEDASAIPISTAPGDQDGSAVTANGPFLVVWRDRRSGTGTDVFAARVGDGGAVQDTGGVPVATAASDEAEPAVAAGVPGGDRFGIVYNRVVAGPPLDSTRAFFRRFSK